MAAFALLPYAIAADQGAALRERVESWWSARVRGDHAGMYALYDPEYRAKVGYEAFLPESVTRSRVPVGAYRLERVKIDGERATVELTIELMGLRGGAGSTLTEENWVLRPGGWFKAYVPAYTPFDRLSR